MLNSNIDIDDTIALQALMYDESMSMMSNNLASMSDAELRQMTELVSAAAQVEYLSDAVDPSTTLGLVESERSDRKE